jgi:hypothetical protein
MGMVFAATATLAADLSSTAGLRVWHDTNVYLQDPADTAAGAASPGMRAREGATATQAALALRESWHPAEGLALDANYGAELTRYFAHASENHADHTLALAAAERAGLWTAEFNARVLYVDGSREAPVYLQPGGAPAIGGEPVRARREQATERVSARLVRQAATGFVRGTWSWQNQDFQTLHRTTPGYVNYTARGEWLFGVDAGRRVGNDLTVFAGVRAGDQHQANLLGLAQNYSNSLLRGLVGVEGAVSRSLKLAVSVGPDWRRYGPPVRTGFERHQQTTYAEANLTWTPTPTDAFTFTGKRYLWLGSTGRGAYLDTSVEFGWKRRFDASWSLGASAGFHEGDSCRYNPAARRDQIYTATVMVTRNFRTFRISGELMHDWADSLVACTSGREYSRWLPAISATRSW